MINFREKLYQFLSEYINQHGSSPSFSEITQTMGISANSKSLITRSLRQLEKEGKLILVKEGRRVAISLIVNQLFLMGRISAGVPIEAIADPRPLNLDNCFFQGSNRFALQVKGDSMIEEGILDGDIIVCKKAGTAQEGDVVVVLIDGHGATLKRISYKMSGMITLVPANNTLKPRAYAPERIQIQGIYTGLVRASS